MLTGLRGLPVGGHPTILMLSISHDGDRKETAGVCVGVRVSNFGCLLFHLWNGMRSAPEYVFFRTVEFFFANNDSATAVPKLALVEEVSVIVVCRSTRCYVLRIICYQNTWSGFRYVTAQALFRGCLQLSNSKVGGGLPGGERADGHGEAAQSLRHVASEGGRASHLSHGTGEDLVLFTCSVPPYLASAVDLT